MKLSVSQYLRKTVKQMYPRILSVRPGASSLCILLLLLAAALRFPTTDYGLPYEYGWDEPEIMLPAIRLIRDGVYIPYKFDYGPLNGYLHAGWAVISFVRGLGDGHFPDNVWGIQTENATGWYWTVTSPWLLQQARVLSALLGLLSIALVYAAAMRLWNSIPAALWAGAVLGLNAIFVNQTSFVTADATSMAAACVCLWASVYIYTERVRWAYIGAAIAAAATMAFKYNNVVIVILPVIAHFLGRSITTDTKPGWPDVLRYIGWFCVAALLFMFPVFLKPVRFLNDVGTLLSYYVVPPDRSTFSLVSGYIERGLSLLDMGYVSAPGRDLKSADQIGFDLSWFGIGVVLTTVAGLLASLLQNLRMFFLLLPVVLLNFINVGGDTGFFYTRYLLLSLPFLALFAGYGVFSLLQQPRLSKLPRYIAPVALLVLMLPYFYHAASNTAAAEATIDPRTQLASWMQQNVESGKKVLVLEESRWHVTREQSRQWQISKATVPQLLQSPGILSGKDYLIGPASVYFHSPAPEHSAMADRINQWLASLKPEVRYGEAPIAFDGPDVNPGIQIVKVSSLPSMEPHVPENSINGIAFAGPSAGSTVLGNGVLGIKAGATVSARVRVTTESKTLTVRAQGTSPYEQKEPPALTVTLTPEQSGAPLPAQTFTLGRSQSGIHDYSRSLNIPAGVYVVSVRADDADYFLTRLESVSVAP